jgi:hypothetical protein
MKHMRRTAGYTWTYKTDTETANELNITRFVQNTGLQEKMDTTCKSNATNTLPRLIKTTPQKAEGTKEDH